MGKDHETGPIGCESGLGLGRVKTPFGGVGQKRGPVRSQAAIAAISGLVPMMFMTRVRL